MEFQTCFDSNSNQILRTLYIITSSVSIAASTAVLLTFLLLPTIRANKNLRLIAYLTFSNLLLALSMATYSIVDWYNHEVMVYRAVVGFGQTYGIYSVTVWGLIFGKQLSCIITNGDLSKEKILIFWGFVVPLVPSTLLGLPIFGNKVVGQDLLISGAVLSLYLVFVYAKVVIEAKKTMNRESANRLIQQIVYYPVVLCINLILSGVATMIMLEYGCIIIMAAGLNGSWCLQGLVDAMLYGNNVIVRDEMKACWKRRYQKRRAAQTNGNEISLILQNSL